MDMKFVIVLGTCYVIVCFGQDVISPGVSTDEFPTPSITSPSLSLSPFTIPSLANNTTSPSLLSSSSSSSSSTPTSFFGLSSSTLSTVSPVTSLTLDQSPIQSFPGPPQSPSLWISNSNGSFTPIFSWQNTSWPTGLSQNLSTWVPAQSLGWNPQIWTQTSIPFFSGRPSWPIVPALPLLNQGQSQPQGLSIPSVPQGLPISSFSSSNSSQRQVVSSEASVSSNRSSLSSIPPTMFPLPPIFNPGPVIPISKFPIQQEMDEIYEDKDIMRPCEIFDTFCIRRHFSENSKCKKRYGPVPDPFYRENAPVYLPRTNISLEMTNIYLRGFNGRITEFYINRETDNLVLSVIFNNLLVTSSYTYFRFHRSGREPIVTGDVFNINFTSIETTIIIPNLKDLKLEKAEVFTYVDDAFPSFFIGPNAFVPQGMETVNQDVAFFANIPADVREGIFTVSTFFIGSFIQYNICDFGLRFL